MWVIKYGGNAMTDAQDRARLLADVRSVRASDGRPVLVHGGGPYIEAELAAAGVESRFERGLRVTTREAIGPVERALTLLGKRLAAELGDAVALTGRDAGLLRAERADPVLGEVGRAVRVRRARARRPARRGVHAGRRLPGARRRRGAAERERRRGRGRRRRRARRAVRVPHERQGVLDDPADPGSRLHVLERSDARARIADGRIAGGMIPKVESALAALDQGAPAAVIADGRRSGELARVQAGVAGTRLVP